VILFYFSIFQILKRKKKSKIARFVQEVPTCSQTIKQLLIFLLSYLVYSQIWLNLLMDDHHQFGYITKLKKKQKTLAIVGSQKYKRILKTHQTYLPNML